MLIQNIINTYMISVIVGLNTNIIVVRTSKIQKDPRVYHEILSKKGLPDIIISQESFSGGVLGHVNVTFFQNEPNTILGHTGDRFNVTCIAPYITRWTSNIPPIMPASYGHAHRYDHNPLKLDHDVKYISEFSIFLPKSESGFIQCESVNKNNISKAPAAATRVYIYTLDGEQLATVRGTVLQPDIFTDTSQNFVVPCHANYPNVTAKLGDFADIRKYTGYSEMPRFVRVGDYDPQVGFVIKGRQNVSNRFVCTAGKQNQIFYVYDPAIEVSETETINFQIVYGDGPESKDDIPLGVTCSIGDTEKPVYIEMINCNSQFECDWLNDCFDIRCRVNRVLAKEGARYGSKTMDDPYTRGKLKCTSEENLVNVAQDYIFTGLDSRQYLLSQLQEAPKEVIIYIAGGERILYTDKPTLFVCQIVNFVLASNIKFAAIFHNGTNILLDKINTTQDPSVREDSVLGFSRRNIAVHLSVDMVGIMCLAPLLDSPEWINSTREFQVKDIQAAYINSGVNGSNTFNFYFGDKTRSLLCNATGVPTPKIQWSVPTELSDKFADINKEEALLHFPTVESNFQGKYVCTASNDYGYDVFTADVIVSLKPPEEPLTEVRMQLRFGHIVAIIGVVAILSTGLIVLAGKYKLARKAIRNLTPEEIKDFFEGNPDYLITTDDTAGAEYKALLMGFNPALKISPSDLTHDEHSPVLGDGEFGRVTQGILNNQAVAVKTTKENTDVECFKALLSELKIMAFVGEHPNIIKFLGAVVSEIETRNVLIVLELSPDGSLENFLRELGPKFLNLMSNCGRIDSRGYTLQQIEMTTSTLNLISWCEQVACGMSYLAEKKVIHGDLASRNVLKFHNDVVKIIDFGLSGKLYSSLQYVKKNKVALPYPWMAIESIRFKKFSLQSDIWSFGVTAWEIFSMAEFPYSGIDYAHPNFLQYLLSGRRLEKPPGVSQNIYGMLLKCWHLEPYERPPFSVLQHFFAGCLESVKVILRKETAKLALRASAPPLTSAGSRYVSFSPDGIPLGP